MGRALEPLQLDHIQSVLPSMGPTFGLQILRTARSASSSGICFGCMQGDPGLRNSMPLARRNAIRRCIDRVIMQFEILNLGRVFRWRLTQSSDNCRTRACLLREESTCWMRLFAERLAWRFGRWCFASCSPCLCLPRFRPAGIPMSPAALRKPTSARAFPWL